MQDVVPSLQGRQDPGRQPGSSLQVQAVGQRPEVVSGRVEQTLPPSNGLLGPDVVVQDVAQENGKREDGQRAVQIQLVTVPVPTISWKETRHQKHSTFVNVC